MVKINIESLPPETPDGEVHITFAESVMPRFHSEEAASQTEIQLSPAHATRSERQGPSRVITVGAEALEHNN